MKISKSLKFKKILSLIVTTCFVLSPAIAGDSYEMKRYVISGGGTSSNGGNYLIRGTIGQAITAQSTGGPYSLQSGYWHLQQQSTDIIFKNGFE